MSVTKPPDAPPLARAQPRASMWLRFGRLLLVLLGVGLVVALAATLPVHMIDFEHYQAGARALWAGRNPYGSVEFFAPPWLALWLGPLLLLPTNIAAVLWLLLACLSVGGSAGLAAHWAARPDTGRARLMGVMVTTLLPAALVVYITGQISALVGLALLAACSAIQAPDRRRRTWLIAAALLVTTFKPHVVIAPLLLCGLELLRRRAWRALTATGLLLAVSVAFAFVVLPGWPGALIAAWLGGAFRGGSGLVATGYVGLPDLGAPWWLFLPLAVYVGVAWWRQGLSPWVVGLALTTGLLLVPYHRVYDHVLLILPAWLAWWSPSLLGGWVARGLILAALLVTLTDFSILAPVLVGAALLTTGSAVSLGLPTEAPGSTC